MLHLHKSAAKKPYHFTIAGSNGNVIETSKNYKEKESAINSMRAIVFRFSFYIGAQCLKKSNQGYKDHTKSKRGVFVMFDPVKKAEQKKAKSNK